MNTRGPIWKVSVSTHPEAEEAVMELLLDLFNHPSSSYTDIETGEVTVATYLPRSWSQVRQVLQCGPDPVRSAKNAPTLRQGLKRIKDCGLNIGSAEISIEKIRRKDWAESWKRHFKPIEIGSTLLIKPSWSKHRTKKGQSVIILDPGLSFGTGQHPTTGFCLQQLAVRASKRANTAQGLPTVTRNSSLSFLDIGTGSGILAIAAAKLGYAPVDAFDFDPESVRVARENARKNRVPQKARIIRADVTKLPAHPSKKYDLVCANLISTLLIAERKRILSRVKSDGTLVVAGILKTEFSVVQKAYEGAGMRLIASRTEKEWRSGTFIFRNQGR